MTCYEAEKRAQYNEQTAAYCIEYGHDPKPAYHLAAGYWREAARLARGEKRTAEYLANAQRCERMAKGE